MPPAPEAPSAAARSPAAGGRPAAGQPQQILGIDRRILIGGAVVFVVALVYIVWRNKQQKQASTSGQPSECTDAQGNPVPCVEASGIDYSGQLSAIQTELESVLAAEGAGGTAGGGGTGGGGTGGVNPGGTDNDGTPGPGPGPKPAAPGPPSGVHATKVTKTSITVAWNKVPGATAYRIRVTYQSRFVKQQITTGTTVTISGLGADHTYGIHVASTNAAGTGAEGDVQIKTSR